MILSKIINKYKKTIVAILTFFQLFFLMLKISFYISGNWFLAEVSFSMVFFFFIFTNFIILFTENKRFTKFDKMDLLFLINSELDILLNSYDYVKISSINDDIIEIKAYMNKNYGKFTQKDKTEKKE